MKQKRKREKKIGRKKERMRDKRQEKNEIGLH